MLRLGSRFGDVLLTRGRVIRGLWALSDPLRVIFILHRGLW